MMRIAPKLLPLVVALVGLLLYSGAGSPATASHHDNDNDGSHQLLFFENSEMNARTAQGLAISVYPGFIPAQWPVPISNAVTAWNSALSPTTGFNVFTFQSGAVMIAGANDRNVCGMAPGGGASHGCPLFDFNYQTPAGTIYMYTPAFAINTHRQSDVMHELGHVLYNAAEHYVAPNAGYNCSSIMGHCNSPTLTAVQGHDITDFSNAYRM